MALPSRRDLVSVLVLLGFTGAAVWLLRRPPPPPRTGPFQRDQVFFVSDDASLLLTLVVQRQKQNAGGLIEIKAFSCLDGVWRDPLYESMRLPRWPGPEGEAALEAWEVERSGAPLRASWQGGPGLGASLQSTSSQLSVQAEALGAPLTGSGPHGPLAWRSGRGSAELLDRSFKGLLVHEVLDGDTPLPSFGRFEMWLLRAPDGALVLGRSWPPELGRALRVGSDGHATLEAFSSTPVESDAAAPPRWSVQLGGEPPLALYWSDGSASEGVDPRGERAYYRIGAVDGDASALVFQIEDAAGTEQRSAVGPGGTAP